MPYMSSNWSDSLVSFYVTGKPGILSAVTRRVDFDIVTQLTHLIIELTVSVNVTIAIATVIYTTSLTTKLTIHIIELTILINSTFSSKTRQFTHFFQTTKLRPRIAFLFSLRVSTICRTPIHHMQNQI